MNFSKLHLFLAFFVFLQPAWPGDGDRAPAPMLRPKGESGGIIILDGTLARNTIFAEGTLRVDCKVPGVRSGMMLCTIHITQDSLLLRQSSTHRFDQVTLQDILKCNESDTLRIAVSRERKPSGNILNACWLILYPGGRDHAER